MVDVIGEGIIIFEVFVNGTTIIIEIYWWIIIGIIIKQLKNAICRIKGLGNRKTTLMIKKDSKRTDGDR